MAQNVYQMVTDRIVEMMNQGIIPWEKPWKGMSTSLKDCAISYTSRKPYSLLNQILLGEDGEYITSALSEMGEGNTIDLRANRYPYDVRNDYCVYSITEVEDAWDFVKDAEEWYVDIYENMKSEGRAEYADYAVASWQE